MSAAVQNSSPLLLVADAHVRPDTPAAQEFREFLSWVATTNYDVAFLGDILELWIGLKRYETTLSAEFLAWCVREKARRRIYFVEGNHEFFVTRHHAECFTASATRELSLDKVVLAHGDTIQPIQANRLFRKLFKSSLMHFYVRWFPLAPYVVRRLKRKFEQKAAVRVPHYPAEDVVRWSEECFAGHPAARRAILGHFHCHQEHFFADGRQTTVLPAWKDTHEVGLLNFNTFRLEIQTWRDLAHTGS